MRSFHEYCKCQRIGIKRVLSSVSYCCPVLKMASVKNMSEAQEVVGSWQDSKEDRCQGGMLIVCTVSKITR